MSSPPDFAEIYGNFGPQNKDFLKFAHLRVSSADYAAGLEAAAMTSWVDVFGLMMKTS